MTKLKKFKKTDDKGPETNDDKGTVPDPDKREKTDEVPTCEQEEPVSKKPATALPTDPAIAIPKVETNAKVEQKDDKGPETNDDKGPVTDSDEREKTDEVPACEQEDPVLEKPAASLPTPPAIAIPKAHKVETNGKAQKQDDKGPETNNDKGPVPGLDKREKTDEVLACDQEDPVLEKPATALPTAPAIALPKAHKVETNDKAQKQDDRGPETDDKGPVPGLDKREKTDEVLACDQEDPVLENPAAALPTTLAIVISEAHKVEANDKVFCQTHLPQVTRGKIRTRSDKLVSTLNGDAWQKSPKYVYELDCPACSEKDLESIYFYDAVEDEHGIFCCVTCSNLVCRIVERQGIKSKSGWEKWDKKEYRQYPRSQWDVSELRTFTLLDKVSEEQPCPKTQAIGKPKDTKTKSKRKVKTQFKPKVKSKSPEFPQKTMITPIHDLTVSDDEGPSLPSTDIPEKKSQPAQKKRKAPSYHQHNKRQKTSIDPRSLSEENKPAVPAAAVVAVKNAVELIVRCLNSYMGTNLQVTERSDA